MKKNKIQLTKSEKQEMLAEIGVTLDSSNVLAYHSSAYLTEHEEGLFQAANSLLGLAYEHYKKRNKLK